MASSRIFPQFSLTGRTAIVSGAGSGLGLAIAEALAEAGANVAILYHKNGAAVDAAKQVAKEYNVKCIAYQVDVTQPDEVESTVNQVVNEFNGRLDCFIANSGIAWNETSVLDSSISHYREVMATNLDSVYYCARAAGMHWRRQAKEQTTIDGKKLEGFQKGSFVATASMSGHIVNYPHIQTAYNASKAGVIHMCRSLAVEWVDFARANTVSPGFIESGLTGAVSEDVKETLREKTPVKRIGDLYEMKGAYLYLASDASSFATGTDIVADGGYRLW
ncbi:hypothetical protein V499_02541 [Pseudogymnoascus sp. VKM F-103]|uniref:L-xylulose reductase n=1 Tax=Pseudogymnoascus verrucosus TaxID=342668 RepID=A0A1B8GXH0_9PEZI|nr:uncharacterized protein VE01_01041 [Pseudogymnoascus verrucosus]KFY78225.1 hypothetical protein V499_02541 [Pseudogymnoascus sp. VKM F-103]OBU00526.1 hypothetical protein VE01_01041 [Pseudogymnoascus verrucosus]